VSREYEKELMVRADSVLLTICFLLIFCFVFLWGTFIWIYLIGRLNKTGFVLFGLTFLLTLNPVYHVVNTLLWNIYGREHITLKNNILTLTKEFLFFRTINHYPYSKISDLDTQPKQENTFSSVPMDFNDKCTIRFNYNDQVVLFGYNLDEEDAETIVSQLTSIIKNNNSAA
jgi:hypothetical protein